MKSVYGIFGIGAIEGVSVLPTDGIPLLEVAKLLIQAILALGSLRAMFPKKTHTKN